MYAEVIASSRLPDAILVVNSRVPFVAKLPEEEIALEDTCALHQDELYHDNLYSSGRLNVMNTKHRGSWDEDIA